MLLCGCVLPSLHDCQGYTLTCYIEDFCTHAKANMLKHMSCEQAQLHAQCNTMNMFPELSSGCARTAAALRSVHGSGASKHREHAPHISSPPFTDSPSFDLLVLDHFPREHVALNCLNLPPTGGSLVVEDEHGPASGIPRVVHQANDVFAFLIRGSSISLWKQAPMSIY